MCTTRISNARCDTPSRRSAWRLEDPTCWAPGRGKRLEGREAVAAGYASSFAAFPDSEIRNEGEVVEGNHYVHWGRFRGALTGSWLGLPPTNRRLDMPFAAVIRALARRCRIRSVPKGAVIFLEGESPEGLFVVLTGRVRLVRASAGGREQVLHAEGAGSTLAEVPVFEGAGYVASAVAMETCRVMMIPRAAVLDACRRHPAVALGVIRTLAQRVRTFADLVETLALRDVTARVARFLVDEAHRAGSDEFPLLGTREEIGARLGTVRELVARSLSRLQAAGVIECAKRRVRVRDLAGLTRFAEAGRN